MCDPISAIAVGSLAISTTGEILKNKAQSKARKETVRANEQLKEDTTDSANAAYTVDINTINARAKQENAAALDITKQNTTTARRSVLASTRAAAIADAQSRVSAGAAGVKGASVDALLGDITRVESANELTISDDLTKAQGNIRSNLAMSEEQANLERQQAYVNRQNRINGVSNLQAPPAPNPWASALQIGGSVLDFSQFLTTRKPNK